MTQRSTEIIRRVKEEQGWTDSTLLDLLIDYIENQDSPEAVESFLAEHCADTDEQEEENA